MIRPSRSIVRLPEHYHGIFFMLLAALCFSLMGGAAKLLTKSFTAGQLVFYRNLVGAIFLIGSFAYRQPGAKREGGRVHMLLFRGLMGTVALYTLLYCILHIPLGTAMTYNLTSALFIAVFSFVLFREYHGRLVLLAVLLGFAGMLLVYKPAMHFPWEYHLAGLVSGVSSAIAYLTVGKLNRYYDARVIVASFVFTGLGVSGLSMLLQGATGWAADEIFLLDFRAPVGLEWVWVLFLGLAALFGQYFVTRAYGADKAGVVSAISYANIVFSLIIGMGLGDPFPDLMSLGGIACIILSGIIISMVKKRNLNT